jgi:hypothetical protein
MSYEQKYLKYKQKYLALKMQEGSGLTKAEKEAQKLVKKQEKEVEILVKKQEKEFETLVKNKDKDVSDKLKLLEKELKTKFLNIPNLKKEDIEILKHDASLKYLLIVDKLLEDQRKGFIGDKKVDIIDDSEFFNEISYLPKLIIVLYKLKLRRDCPRSVFSNINIMSTTEEEIFDNELKSYQLFILLNRQSNEIQDYFINEIISICNHDKVKYRMDKIIRWLYNNNILLKLASIYHIFTNITILEFMSTLRANYTDNEYYFFINANFIIDHLCSIKGSKDIVYYNIFHYQIVINVLLESLIDNDVKEKNILNYDKTQLLKALTIAINTDNSAELDYLKGIAYNVELSYDKKDEQERVETVRTFDINSRPIYTSKILPYNRDKLMNNLTIKLDEIRGL